MDDDVDGVTSVADIDNDIEFINLDDDVNVDEAVDDVSEDDADSTTEGRNQSSESIHSDNDSVNVDGNEFYVLAQHWKEEGLIPDDAIVEKDISPEKLDELYRARLDASLDSDRELYKKEWLTEYRDRLEAYGVNPDMFFEDDSVHTARVQLAAYTQLADSDYYDLEDASTTIPSMGIEYYLSKGMDYDEAKELYERDTMDKGEEELFSKYQNHFKNSIPKLEQIISNHEQSIIDERANKAKADAEAINKIISLRKIGDREYSKEDMEKVAHGLMVKDQIYESPRGERRRVTLFDKIRMEINDSPEKLLAFAADAILGIDNAVIKDRSETIGKNKILNELAKAGGSTAYRKSTVSANDDGLFIPI